MVYINNQLEEFFFCICFTTHDGMIGNLMFSGNNHSWQSPLFATTSKKSLW